MSEFFIAPIVEGHGEVQAVPVLLQRFAQECGGASLRVNPPLRIKSGSFLNDPDYFRRYVALAAGKAAAHDKGHVLILLDCEDDCPGELGPKLLERARAVRNDVSITVALAHREYETWFLAAAGSLAGVLGLPQDIDAPSNPEAIRDAKGWLDACMPQPYNEPLHQSELTRIFSFDRAAAIPSFARLQRKMAALFVQA